MLNRAIDEMEAPVFNVPMIRPEDVIPHLGSLSHWKVSRSAHALATTWFSAGGIPTRIRGTLEQSPLFAEAQLIDGIFEKKVDLRISGAKPSQTDLLAILGIPGEIAIMSVEGKVDEPFGPLTGEWLDDAKARSKRPAILEGLATTLELESEACRPLRYQLIHRTVAAIYEAQRYRSRYAIMMVHSFDQKNAGIEDFLRFLAALNVVRMEGGLSEPITRGGIQLFLGWTSDTAPSA